jgi:hypothetical protein
MALKIGSDGEIRLVLKVQDDGTAVIEKFSETSTAQLKQASDQAGAAGKELAENTQKHTEGAGMAWVGLGKKAAIGIAGVIGAAGAMMGAGTQIFKFADQMNEAAEKLGTTTEWLSKISYAAELSGTSMNAIATSFTSMSAKIAQAAQSGKGIADTLQRIGLSAEALQQMGPERAFEAILAAIEKLPDPMERTQARLEIFGGRSAKELGALAAALRESGDDAERFGLIVSGQAGRNADMFFDQLVRVRRQMTGMGNIVANELAGPFAQLAKTFADFLRESGALRGVATGMIIALRGIGAVVVAVGTAFGLAGKALGGFLAVLDALKRGELREALGIARETGKELAEVIKRFAELEKQMLGLSGGEGGMRKMGFFPAAANDGTWSDVLPGADVKTMHDAEAAETDEHQDAMLARRRDFHFELQQIDAQAAAARQEIVDRALQGEANAMATMANYVAGLMQSKSRTLFQIGKTAAIAEAIVSTYQAVNNALALKPFWVGLAMSGVALAKGLANVQAIRAVQFGSQAAAPVFSANANTGLPAAPLAANDSTFVQTQTQTTAQPQFSRVEHYTLTGNFFDDAFMRDTMIPMIRRAQKDGVFLDFSFQQAA